MGHFFITYPSREQVGSAQETSETRRGLHPGPLCKPGERRLSLEIRPHQWRPDYASAPGSQPLPRSSFIDFWSEVSPCWYFCWFHIVEHPPLAPCLQHTQKAFSGLDQHSAHPHPLFRSLLEVHGHFWQLGYKPYSCPGIYGLLSPRVLYIF